MSFAQSIIAYFISPLIGFFILLILAEVILSWLLAFNVINLRNPMVAQIRQAIRMITEPVLKPIRRILPPMAGLDLSPLIAFFVLQWANGYLFRPGSGVIYTALG